jgi:hypothetical protein
MLLYTDTDTKVNRLFRALSPNVSDLTFLGPEYNFLLRFPGSGIKDSKEILEF